MHTIIRSLLLLFATNVVSTNDKIFIDTGDSDAIMIPYNPGMMFYEIKQIVSEKIRVPVESFALCQKRNNNIYEIYDDNRTITDHGIVFNDLIETIYLSRFDKNMKNDVINDNLSCLVPGDTDSEQNKKFVEFEGRDLIVLLFGAVVIHMMMGGAINSE